MTEAEAALDPFTGRLAFVDRIFRSQRARVRTWFDRSRIQPIEPLDSGADRIVNYEALEAMMDWQGLVRRPRPMPKDAYPSEIEEAMQHREPQFILRNLGRVEKEVDPDEPLPLDRRPLPIGAALDGLDSAKDVRHEPPQLLDEMTVDVFSEQHGVMRRLYREPWNRRFSKELRADHTGPMWSYDPDAAEAKRAAAAAEGAVEDATAEDAPELTSAE